jgi:hypothetical protein
MALIREHNKNGLLERIMQHEKLQLRHKVRAIFGAVIIVVLFFFMFKALFESFDRNNIYFKSVVLDNSHAFSFSLFMLIGGLLYVVKLKTQLLYGLLELSFAIATIWYTTSDESQKIENAANLVKIAGGAYLIVRGLTNIKEGRDKILNNSKLKKETNENTIIISEQPKETTIVNS